MDHFVCIITGANSLSGIGRATAYEFAKRKPQAIYVVDLFDDNLAELANDITGRGVECIPKKMDASCDEEIQNVIEEVLQKYGRLDVFFANAGVAIPGALEEETREKFLSTMTINAWSVFAAIKYASIAMEKVSATKKQGGGSIIATASVAGVRSGAGPMSYSASKAAVINIVQSAAWRLRGKNIRVNAICPGIIETAMTDKVLGIIQRDDAMTSNAEKSTALGRYGQASEIANMVTFLASSEASYITGQDIKVDGGLTAALPHVPILAYC
ncbi:NAD-binding protein [Radiomyces spectabilis]|uniref:NAD-binding protein n=1 Tax=Radiomyces spectabilis TaxID=64574 RepID=UPI00221ECDD3|nr:NAD-binding protein [Radiomyces spectabilis]KAI8379055.1 NAD-binding protein [Radiomyces spectabilis]